MTNHSEKTLTGTHHPAAAPRHGERGSVLAYTVLSVLFLFLAVGLGADLSHLYLVKTELQNAADASALAGASALLLSDEEAPIATAVDRAVAVMNQNKYNFNQQEFVDTMTLADQRNLVEFAVNLDGTYYKEADVPAGAKIRFVKVVTPAVPVNIYFALPILGISRNLTATATSGLSVPSNVFCNYLPIAVVEGTSGGGRGLLDTNNNGVADRGDCPTLPEDSDCDPVTQFCPTCKYKMVAGPGAWEDTSPGNYQALDAGDGAKDLKLAIAGGTSLCLTSNDDAEFITETEPGRMTGPITKGVNSRFDIYKVNDCPPGITCSNFGGEMVTIGGETKPVHEAFPPDKNIYAGEGPPDTTGPPTAWVYPGISYQQYQDAIDPTLNWASPDHTGYPNRREVMLPIINQSEFDAGKDTVKFTKVGKFFLNKFVDEGNNEIYVEFIEPALGAGGFDPEGGITAPVVVPVLYR